MKCLNVVLLGASAVDVVVRVRYIPGPDDIVLAEGVKVFPGGSTANVAVGLAKLGVRCGIVCRVGRDRYGELLVRSLERSGVDTSRVLVGSGRTARTLVIIDGEGRRAIISLGGEAIVESVEEVDLSYVLNADVLYIGEALPRVAEEVARAARREGLTVIYSPGGLFTALGVKGLKGVVRLTDILIVSRVELAKLVPTAPNLEEGLRELSGLGPDVIVVTLGSEGSLAYRASDGAVILRKAFRVNVKDTTGAGDAFTAGFMYGIIKGLDIGDSLTLGNAVAALKITRLGPRSSPTIGEVVEFLEEVGLGSLAGRLR